MTGKNDWDVFVAYFIGCVVCGLIIVGVDAINVKYHTSTNLIRVEEVGDIQRTFNENFKIICSSREGFNKTLKACDEASRSINEYHAKDFEADGWMDKSRDNYNGKMWNTTPAVMKAYHRDAFVIWCVSKDGLGLSPDWCLETYKCLNEKLARAQGWTGNFQECD